MFEMLRIDMQLSLPSILCVTYAFYAKMKRKTSKTSKTSEDKNKDENKDEDENENKDETNKVYPMSRTN